MLSFFTKWGLFSTQVLFEDTWITLKKWVLFLFFSYLQSSFSEKATKLRKNLPLVLMLLSKNSCFVKSGGRLVQILWPSNNFLTLLKISKTFPFTNSSPSASAYVINEWAFSQCSFSNQTPEQERKTDTVTGSDSR